MCYKEFRIILSNCIDNINFEKHTFEMNIEDTLYRVGINDFLEVAGNEVIKDFYIGPFTEFSNSFQAGIAISWMALCCLFI